MPPQAHAVEPTSTGRAYLHRACAVPACRPMPVCLHTGRACAVPACRAALVPHQGRALFHGPCCAVRVFTHQGTRGRAVQAFQAVPSESSAIRATPGVFSHKGYTRACCIRGRAVQGVLYTRVCSYTKACRTPWRSSTQRVCVMRHGPICTRAHTVPLQQLSGRIQERQVEGGAAEWTATGEAG